VSTDNARTQELVARLEAMRRQEAALLEQIARARAEQWQARRDDVDLGAHLGTVDLRDRIGPVVDAVQDRLRQVRADLADDRATAADVVDALRAAFDRAVEDVCAATDPTRPDAGPLLRGRTASDLLWQLFTRTDTAVTKGSCCARLLAAS